jgi:L-malate glycosyltransferase
MSQNKRIKVLFLPAWYPHRGDPMAGLFVHRHGIAVSKHTDVSVLFVISEPNINCCEIRSEQKDGLFITRVYYRDCRVPVLGKIIKFTRFLMAWRKGYKAIKQESGKPDLVHVHVLTRLGVIALWLKKFKGIPYVITEHWTRYLPEDNSFRGFFRKLATRFAVKHASVIMPVTENLAEAMKAHSLQNNQYNVIPNVVDSSLFVPAFKKTANNDIIHISCFDNAQKNITGLLDAFKIVKTKVPDSRLLLVGDGADADLIKSYANKIFGDDQSIIFLGSRNGSALVEILNSSAVLAIASHYENLPVVMLEAFCCGIPVVSTNVGGIREHLIEQNGILVPPKATDELAKALIQVLSQSEKYESAKIRQYAVAHFSEEAIAEAIFLQYQKALVQQ